MSIGEKGGSLRSCILHQAAQTTTGVEHALMNHIHRSQVAMSLLRKRLVAVEQETQQCRDLMVWVQERRAEVSEPLQVGKLHQHSRVGVGFQTEMTASMDLASTPRAKNRAAVGDAPATALVDEAKEVAQCTKAATSSLESLQLTVRQLEAMAARMTAQCEWLQHNILRDNDCITSAPSRPYHTKQMYNNNEATTLSATGSDFAAVAEGSLPHHSALSASIGRRGHTRHAAGTLSPAAKTSLSPLGWESESDATYQDAGQMIERSAETRKMIVALMKKELQDCAIMRKAVLDAFDKCINEKLRLRQRHMAEIDTIEKRIIDVKKQWKGASEAAIELKKPIDVTDERQRMRNNTADAVGEALAGERVILRQGRHELKKLCKTLSNEMKEMRARVGQLRAEIALLDQEMAVDRLWMTLDQPLATGSKPGVARIESKRTFAKATASRVQLGDVAKFPMFLTTSTLRPVSSPRAGDSALGVTVPSSEAPRGAAAAARNPLEWGPMPAPPPMTRDSVRRQRQRLEALDKPKATGSDRVNAVIVPKPPPKHNGTRQKA